MASHRETFGEDESAGRKKLADYVGRVEKRIRSIINLLKDAKRIKRNPALAGELGFNFSTETDIANARAQLEILLDAYQHPKQGEMEDVKRKAAAWDGKSPVNPTLSELIGEAKLLVPYSTAEASPAEDTKIMDDLFSSMALDAKELTFENREYSNAECIKALASDSETPFVNDETGIEARINRKQRDKITSGAAQRKSEASGFRPAFIITSRPIYENCSNTQP